MWSEGILRVLGTGSGVFRLSRGEFRGSAREFGVPGFREARDHPTDQPRDPSPTTPLGGYQGSWGSSRGRELRV